MSRRKGSKNTNGIFYGTDRLNKKAIKLASQIDNFINTSWTNPSFNKLVGYDDLHKIKTHLIEIAEIDQPKKFNY